MEPHHHHQQHQIGTVNVDTADRFPQWSIQETRDFLILRSELDQAFMETKRNKLLWEVISNKLKEKGCFRSPEQCKCKWKNLVTGYKGCETMGPESLGQQFPFYNELQAIFANRMQRMLWAEEEAEATTGGSGTRKKKAVQISSDEEDDNIEESEEEQLSVRKKKKAKTAAKFGSGSGSSSNNLKAILGEFMNQQIGIEMQWREEFEAQQNEMRMKEFEWRQRMEALENERIMMDRRWREREEQRRIREEGRAEKRDALVTSLLNKLRREDN